MESYETWFGEGPELSVLRMLGLFDRPVDEKVLGALLNPPTVHGLTESLDNLSPSEWGAIVSRLRRAKLLAGEDPHDPGHLDVHPLIREYFGEQLRYRLPGAWRECHRRLFDYYRMFAPQLPDNFREMEPLFLAVICGCNAGLLRDALHEVYISRIQRGIASFAANVLGVRGALLSVLVHFFEQGRWGSPVATYIEGQSLTTEDQLFVFMQAAINLSATQGMAAREALICYERAESLCHSLNCPQLLYATLMGQWRYSFMTEKLSAAMQIAKRLYSVTQVQNDPALMMGAYTALARTHYHLGDFEAARRDGALGIQLWRSGAILSPVEELSTPAVICFCDQAHSNWHLGEIESCHAAMAEAISLAKELNDTHALAMALLFAAVLAYYERSPAEAERLASEIIEMSTRQGFAQWLAYAKICRGWGRSVLGDSANGLLWIEDALRDYMASGSIRALPDLLAVKAEALHLADRTCEALETIREAEALVERYEERSSLAELQRLRGVFLATMGADETNIEISFYAAMRTAKEQKSMSLAKRAAATYEEYRRQKARALGGHEFRLTLCSGGIGGVRN
jgi:tetratricopeptide (TPR) repeat protein